VEPSFSHDGWNLDNEPKDHPALPEILQAAAAAVNAEEEADDD